MIVTGIPGLDPITGGGFPSNTNILLSGDPGSGKTLLGMSFLLEGARKKEKCCYVSLNETGEDILRACEKINSLKDAKKYAGRNLAIEHISLSEGETMKSFLRILSRYPKIDRLVIDNLNKLFLFSESRKDYRMNLSNMMNQLKRISGCTLLLCESNNAMDSGNGEAFESDGVIQLSFLDFEEKPMRTLRVHKMRYASFDPRVPHELVITGSGIKIGEVKII